jgi:hypothetical protein
MYEQPLISIAGFSLIDAFGVRYKCQMNGYELFETTENTVHQVTSGGGLFTQYNEFEHAGKLVAVVIDAPEKEIAEQIIAALKTANQSKTTVPLSFQWGFINYVGTAKPQSGVIATWDKITTKTYTNLRIPLILVS